MRFVIAISGFAGLLTSVAFAAGMVPLPEAAKDADYRDVSVTAAQLGQLLFYDPILSGNKEVACATCHHPAFGTGDGLSLSLGDGGTGLGPLRVADPENPPEQRVPRNAQALFNLGAHEYSTLFHDGRVELDPASKNGMRTPLGADMVEGFDSQLAAQSMFPVLSADEMAGHFGENEISSAVRIGRLTGQGGAWDILAQRVAAFPEYVLLFQQTYPHITEADQIRFTDIANAMAAFMEFEWRSDTAPFDLWLRGEADLAPEAARGAWLFYGDAGCSTCHSGAFQTDHSFHATGQVQIGPGKARRFETHARDVGRFGVTGQQQDMFAFRTPSLRNVMLTAPYGHAGAYRDLSVFLAAHTAPETAFTTYDISQPVLPDLPFDDYRVAENSQESKAITAASSPMTRLSADQMRDILAFLESLTDPMAVTGRLGVPATVPSGLTVPNP